VIARYRVPVAAADAGLFGPGSVTWRINREQALLLGGGCALLEQLAHPLVAAGVSDHSDFKSDPLKRLRRTLDATLAIVFGTTEEAQRSAAQIRAVHSRVQGALRSDTGRFAAGTPYRAEEPSLLAWVNATLFDTSIRTYELLFSPLPPADLHRYYAESCEVARILGVPETQIAPTFDGFRAWWSEMLRGEDVAIGADARDLARSVMTPTIRFVPRPAFAPLSLFTIGLLPEPVRDRYGFRWSAARERAFRASAAAIGATARALPARLRLFPQARAAERRMASAAA
jgi:uncharacterized protein (DUF2236 family)